MTSTLHLYK